MIIPIKLTSERRMEIEGEIEKLTFDSLGLTESDIEEFIRNKVELLFENDADGGETLLIVGQQVVDVKGARNDLVAVDGSGNLVLIEIKRDAADIIVRAERLEFQAVRYAASLATIRTVDELVDKIYSRYVQKWKEEFALGEVTPSEMARRKIETFLSKTGSRDFFNQKQRIILVSSSFDEQTLSAAAWMNSNGVDISCICLAPVRKGSDLFLNAEILIPRQRIEEYFVPFRDASNFAGDTREIREGKIKSRTPLPRMAKLMEWGVIAKGTVLKIKNFPNSEATIIDSKFVDFQGEKLRFNEWGKRVTAWSSIAIYDWAETRDGNTLSELRAARMDAERTSG